MALAVSTRIIVDPLLIENCKAVIVARKVHVEYISNGIRTISYIVKRFIYILAKCKLAKQEHKRDEII